MHYQKRENTAFKSEKLVKKKGFESSSCTAAADLQVLAINFLTGELVWDECLHRSHLSIAKAWLRPECVDDLLEKQYGACVGIPKDMVVRGFIEATGNSILRVNEDVDPPGFEAPREAPDQKP
jgi:hypothetical protein